MELVRLAARLDRLPELATDIDTINIGTNADRRSKIALQALIALQGTDAALLDEKDKPACDSVPTKAIQEWQNLTTRTLRQKVVFLSPPRSTGKATTP